MCNITNPVIIFTEVRRSFEFESKRYQKSDTTWTPVKHIFKRGELAPAADSCVALCNASDQIGGAVQDEEISRYFRIFARPLRRQFPTARAQCQCVALLYSKKLICSEINQDLRKSYAI